MKVVYYYSPRQEKAAIYLKMWDRRTDYNSQLTDYLTPTVDGMKYTEMRHLEDDDDIPLKNAWPDSSIVLIRHGLDVEIDHNGRRWAKLK